MSTEPTPFSLGVSQAVRAAMTVAGATPFGVAAATGIPRATLLRRLSGTSSFTVAELDAIAAHLELDVARFLVPQKAAV